MTRKEFDEKKLELHKEHLEKSMEIDLQIEKLNLWHASERKRIGTEVKQDDREGEMKYLEMRYQFRLGALMASKGNEDRHYSSLKHELGREYSASVAPSKTKHLQVAHKLCRHLKREVAEFLNDKNGIVLKDLRFAELDGNIMFYLTIGKE